MSDLSGPRKCPDCGEKKTPPDFPRSYAYCRNCHNARTRETVQRLYGGYRHYRLRNRYGIGAEEVQRMIEGQGGVCALCETRPATQVDHDHRTGHIRAVLCLNCNAGLGLANDDVRILLSAIEYLTRNKGSARDDVVPYTKQCRDCGLQKRLEDFPIQRRRNDGRHIYCRYCFNERAKISKHKHHGSQREYLLRLRYGITQQNFDQLLGLQLGRCAVCMERPPKHVDHEHEGGRVRGLLCVKCNNLLGHAGDDPMWFEKAIAYLERHSGQAGSVREDATPYIIHVA